MRDDEKKAAGSMTIQEARLWDGELAIELWYPDVEDSDVKKIRIGLMDVRAADDIRVSYDKKRDGWKIEQASIFEWEGDEERNEDWQEVAFIKAWKRKDERDELIKIKLRDGMIIDDITTSRGKVKKVSDVYIDGEKAEILKK